MALATQQQADALECPRCKQIDQVQRVSSIVESGTSTSLHRGRGLIGGYAFFGRHSGGPVVGVSRTTTRGVQQTQLAGKLVLRGAPRAGSTGGAVVSAAPVMGITGVLLAGLGVLILGAMGPGLGSVLGLGLFLAMGLGLVWGAVRHKEQRVW